MASTPGSCGLYLTPSAASQNTKLVESPERPRRRIMGDELLFCLQVHVTSFRSGSNLTELQEAPQVAFSFLDYAPQIIHPRPMEDPERPGKCWSYERGKSCLLSATARGMRRSLHRVPLVVMLVGEIRQASSKQARLYATSCLSLASFIPAHRADESLVSTWGHFRGVVDVYTYKNQVGGCLDLSVSLVSYGPRHTHPFLDHLLPASTRRPLEHRGCSPLRDAGLLAHGHVSPPRPSAIRDVRGSPDKRPADAVDAGPPSDTAPGDNAAAAHVCPTERVGNIEPFRLWDADLCGSRCPPAPSAVAAALPVMSDDPPPLFYYHAREPGDEPYREARLDQTCLRLSPIHSASRSVVSPMREPWRDPGIAKVPMGRSKSVSPERRRRGSRTPGRRRRGGV